MLAQCRLIISDGLIEICVVFVARTVEHDYCLTKSTISDIQAKVCDHQIMVPLEIAVSTSFRRHLLKLPRSLPATDLVKGIVFEPASGEPVKVVKIYKPFAVDVTVINIVSHSHRMPE